MREIVINDNNLLDSDIVKTVTRVKAFIINSNGEVIVVFNNNTYQLPGGHVEDGEDLGKSLEREIREELGIDLEVDSPYLLIKEYDNNYFNTGNKVLNKIYYYFIRSNKMPDFNNTHYDELELESEFNIYYIKFDKLKSFLEKCVDTGEVDIKIEKEMLIAIDEYLEINKK